MMRPLARAILFSCLPAAYAPAQARWSGKIDLAIGGPDETREAYTFSFIHGITSDAAGRIVIALGQENSIRVFSPAGTHLYSFGQRGKGPGDLAFPCCVTVDGKGRLWVRELGNNRYSLFALDEKGARHITSYGVRAGTAPLDRIYWDAAGAILYQTTESSGGPIRTVRLHADTTGKELRRDTLRDPPVDSATRVYVSRVVPGGRSTYSTTVANAPRFIRAEGPGGQLAEANTARYEVDWLDANMTLLRRLTAPAQAPPVSARETARARDAIAAFAEGLKADVDLNAVKFPTRKPVLDDMGFDMDGRLWISRSVADGQPHEADVYDPAGRLVARATWPAGVTLRYSTVRGMSGLGIRVDEDDVQSVVRLAFSR